MLARWVFRLFPPRTPTCPIEWGGTRKGLSPAAGKDRALKIDEGNQQPMPAGGVGQVICPNCAAEFSVEEPRCPYCGKLNPTGAENAYMRTLDGIKDDTEDLADDAEENFESGLRQNTGKVIVVVVAVVALLATLFLVANLLGKSEEQRELMDFQAREAFRTQYFGEFDRLYEAGDDAALSSYVWNLAEEPGFDALFSWEHSDYLWVHDDWEAIQAVSRHLEEGKGDFDDYLWSVEVALRLAGYDASDSYRYAELSPDEKERAAAYFAYAQQFLRDTLQMNDDEVAAFAEGTKDEYGDIQEEKLRQNLRERLESLGVPC